MTYPRPPEPLPSLRRRPAPAPRPPVRVLPIVLAFSFLFGAFVLVQAPPAGAAFVGPTTLMAGTFATSEWNHAAVASFSDLSDVSDSPQLTNNIVKFYKAMGTPNGGTSVPSTLNPIQHVYLRFDHTNTVVTTTNFNIQLNLGSAPSGSVDHLLQLRATGTDAVSVRLNEYATPYPPIGSFTTNTFTLKSSNLASDTAAFVSGVTTQTGLWDATQYSFAVKLPMSFFTNSAACLIKADGSGTVSLLGAIFTSTGSFGAVGTPRDRLSNADGTGMNFLTNTLTGTTTLYSSAATQLAWTVHPANAVAGTTMASVSVEVRTAAGAKVTDATNEVTLAIGTNPGSGTLSGTRTVTAVGGTATFSDLSINNAGTGYTLVASSPGLTGATSNAFNISAAPAAATIAASGGSSFSGVTAGGTQTLSVIVRDQYNNPFQGVTVTWTVTAGGGSRTPATSVTGADGIASTVLTTGTTVGTNTVTAAATGLTGSPVTFTVTTVAGAATQIAAVQSSFSGVTAGNTQVLQAIVRDANNNPKSGVTVTWTVTAGGGSRSPATSTTGADGIASTTLTTGTTVGTNTVTAAATGLSGSPVTFTVTTVAGAATQISAVQASFTGVTAGGTQTLQAIVRDANGNPVEGVTVNWAVTGGGGSRSPASSTTASNGIASTVLTTGTTVGTNTVTATSSGLSGSPVTFTVTTVAGSATQISAVQSTFTGVTAGSTQVLQALVRDANGNAVQGVTVSWAVTAGGGSRSPTSSLTGADGIASTTLTTGTTAGTNTVTATSTGLTGSPVTFTVTTVAGAATQIAAVQSSFAGVTAGGTQALQALVRDANNNPVAGVVVNWAVTGGGGGLSGVTSTTGSDGIATITLTTGPTVGTNTVTATKSGLTGSPVTFTVTTVAGAATQIAAVQSSFSGVTAGNTQVLQAIVRDANANPVSGITVNWAVTAGGGTRSPTSSATGADGVASTTLTTGTTVGTNTVTASSSGLTGSPVTFTVMTVAGPASQIAAVQSSFSGVTAGAQQALQAVVRDANGNVVAGVVVDWSVTAGGGSVSGAQSTTGSDGIATITLTTGTTVGTNNVTASKSGLIGSPVSFTVDTVAGAASQISAVQSSFSGITAGGTQALQALVRDANGNPVAGVNVTWAVTAGGGSLSAPYALSGADGVATVVLTTSTVVGSNAVRATRTGLSGSPVDFTVSTVPAAAARIEAVQDSFTNVVAGSTRTLQARATDAYNNVVPGVRVWWNVTAGGGSLAQASSLTQSNGVASVVLTTGPSAGTNTVTGESSGLAGSPLNFTVSTVAGTATQISAVQSSFTNVVAGSDQVLQVLVEDASNNPVPDTTVTWAVTAGGGSLSASTSVTDANGIANVTLTTGATVGNNTVTATRVGLTGSPIAFTVVTVAGPATQIAAVQSNFTGVTVNTTQVLEAIVRDANGNVVAGVTVNWSIVEGGGSLSGASSVTGADGIARITLTAGTLVGTNTVRAAAAGLAGSPVDFTVGTVPAAAYRIAAVVDAFSGVTAGSDQPLEARVTDRYGNPVRGESVAWAVTAGGGDVSASSSLTNANGVASITLTTGATVGSNTATATKGGLVGSPAEFTVSTVPGAATQISAVQATFTNVVAGGNQTLQAIVKDAHHNPVTGVTVNWAVVVGGGSLSDVTSVTGSDGVASIVLTTNPAVGPNNVTATKTGLTGSPVGFGVSTIAGEAAQIGAVQSSFSGVVAGAMQTLEARVSDANNNPVSGVVVSWAVVSAGGSLSTATSTTGSDGIASVGLTTHTLAGVNNVTATKTGLSGSPVAFSVSTVAGSAARLRADQANFTGVVAGEPQALVAVVEDANGNPVSGVNVTWSVVKGGGSLDVLHAVTGADGRASVTLTTGDAVGSNVARATKDGLAGSPLDFTVATVAGPAAEISAVQGSFTGVVAGSNQTLEAIVRDARGNPVSGVAVTWTVVSGGGSLSTLTSITGSDGVASVLLTTGVTVGTNNVSAASTGLSGSPVTFLASTVPGDAATIAAVQSSFTNVTAGGNQTLEVIVTDAHGNVVPGVSVQWDATLGNGSLSAAASLTGPDGKASVVLTSNGTVRNHTVTATKSGLSGSPVAFTVSTVPGAATQIHAVQADFQNVVAGSSRTLQALVRDAHGNPVAGVTVSWTVVLGNGSVAVLSNVTGSDGIAAATFTSDVRVGPNGVQASATGLTGSPVAYNLSTIAGPAHRIAAVQANLTGVVAGDQRALQASVTDQYGNPVAGTSVQWTVLSGGGSLSDAVSTTDADGVAEIDLTTGLAAGANLVGAASDGLEGSPLTFNVSTVPGSATQIEAVQAAFSGIVAGDEQRLEARVLDAGNNPVAGITVSWTVVSGGGHLSASTSVTGADGVANVTLATGTSAGENRVRAVRAGLTGSPVNFTVETLAGPATDIAAVQSGFTGVTAGANQTLQAVVTDQHGNPVAGVLVDWQITDGAGNLSATSSVTDAAGVASIVLTTGPTVGVNVVTATNASLTGSPVAFSVSTVAGPASQITAVQSTFTGVVVQTTQTLEALVRDANGNPVEGVTVQWTVTLGNGSLDVAASATGADGVARVVFTTGTLVGNNTVRATSGDLAGSPVVFRVATVAGPAARIEAVTPTFSGVTAGSQQLVRVRATDAHGNPVAGVNVTWSVGLGNGSLAAAHSSTDADGIASVLFTTGTGAGNNSVVATAAGLLGSPVTILVTSEAGSAATIAGVQTSFTQVVVGTERTLAVLVLDANGNPVPGVPVAWTVASGGGSLSASTATTGTDGRASVVLTAGTRVVDNVVQASSGDLAGSPVTFTLQTVPDEPYALASPAPVHHDVLTNTTHSLQVRVVDRYGNELPNLTVSWTVVAGNGSVASPTSTTNATGNATMSVTTGPHVAQNRFRASVGALSLTFTFNMVGNPGFTVLESDGSTTVSEGGTTDRIGVVLAARPSSDVVITITSSDAREVTTIPLELTFSPANWDVVQNVTVRGLEEFVVDGTTYTRLTFEVDASRSAPEYGGVGAQNVTVANQDNDVEGEALTMVGWVDGMSAGQLTNFSVAITPAQNLINLTAVAVRPGSAIAVPVVVQATQRAALPSDVPAPPSTAGLGQIWTLDFTDADGAPAAMQGARIEFFVSYAWSNASCPIATCDVVLFHYTAGAWERITPTLLGANATGGLYEAWTTSFSPFVVGGVQRSSGGGGGGGGGATAPTTASPPATSGPVIDAAPIVVPPIEPPPAVMMPAIDASASWTWLLPFVAGFLAASGGAVAYHSDLRVRATRWVVRAPKAAWRAAWAPKVPMPAPVERAEGYLTRAAAPLPLPDRMRVDRPIVPTMRPAPEMAAQQAKRLSKDLEAFSRARRRGQPVAPEAQARAAQHARELTSLLQALRATRAAERTVAPVLERPVSKVQVVSPSMRRAAVEQALKLDQLLVAPAASRDPATLVREAQALNRTFEAMRRKRGARSVFDATLQASPAANGSATPDHGASSAVAPSPSPGRDPETNARAGAEADRLNAMFAAVRAGRPKPSEPAEAARPAAQPDVPPELWQDWSGLENLHGPSAEPSSAARSDTRPAADGLRPPLSSPGRIPASLPAASKAPTPPTTPEPRPDRVPRGPSGAPDALRGRPGRIAPSKRHATKAAPGPSHTSARTPPRDARGSGPASQSAPDDKHKPDATEETKENP